MKILTSQTLHSDNWIKVLKRGYLDKAGREKSWTYIERRNGQRAAVIVAVTRQTGSLILISQFRVPFGREIIEFPAGLIDPGELPRKRQSGNCWRKQATGAGWLKWDPPYQPPAD